MFIPPESLVGTWRRFGVAGPVYEVVGVGREEPNGERIMCIRVVESGEEADYKMTEILDDPREH